MSRQDLIHIWRSPAWVALPLAALILVAYAGRTYVGKAGLSIEQHVASQDTTGLDILYVHEGTFYLTDPEGRRTVAIYATDARIGGYESSPDGGRIAFFADYGDGPGLYVMDRATSRIHRLCNSASVVQEAPTWSHQVLVETGRQWIAYVESKCGEGEGAGFVHTLHIVACDGSHTSCDVPGFGQAPDVHAAW